VLVCVHNAVKPRLPRASEWARLESVAGHTLDRAERLSMVIAERARVGVAPHARTQPRARGLDTVLVERLPVFLVGLLCRADALTTAARGP